MIAKVMAVSSYDERYTHESLTAMCDRIVGTVVTVGTGGTVGKVTAAEMISRSLVVDIDIDMSSDDLKVDTVFSFGRSYNIDPFNADESLVGLSV